jgi:ribulose-5-phosphate 4-epimerase/fuculose-1-phosphate aldolase
MAERKVVAQLKRRLVEGIQVLTGEGVLTGSGHLSARIPGTETFLINPRFAGILADPGDICTVDLSGKRISGKGPIPSETPIHSAIYRARNDVRSVLHCHPRYAILMGVQEGGFVPFSREAARFAGVPIFPSSHGIDNDGLAERMAQVLGQHPAVLLRGHGCVVVGPGIEGTCISAIQLERASMDQLFLMSFTTPKPLPDMEKRGDEARLENPYRAWPFLLYRHKIRSKRAIKAAVRPPKEGEDL